MGRRVGAACSPDKVGSSRGRPRQGVGVVVRWGGRLHGGERRKASSVLPPTRSVEGCTWRLYTDLSNLLVGPRQSPPSPGSPSVRLLDAPLVAGAIALGPPTRHFCPATVSSTAARITTASTPLPLLHLRCRCRSDSALLLLPSPWLRRPSSYVPPPI